MCIYIYIYKLLVNLEEQVIALTKYNLNTEVLTTTFSIYLVIALHLFD